MQSFLCFSITLLMIIIPPAVRNDTGTIEGRIIEEVNDKPIPDAHIEILDTELVMVSNEKGEYLFSHVPTGRHNIKYSAKGFETLIKRNIVIRANRTTCLTVTLKKQSPRISSARFLNGGPTLRVGRIQKPNQTW